MYTSAGGTNTKHAISLKAWLQCHLHSNGAVCHLGTFTLGGFMTTSIPMVSQHIKQHNMSSASSSASLPSAHKCCRFQPFFINTRAICLPGRSSARLGSVRCQVTVFEPGVGVIIFQGSHQKTRLHSGRSNNAPSGEMHVEVVGIINTGCGFVPVKQFRDRCKTWGTPVSIQKMSERG